MKNSKSEIWLIAGLRTPFAKVDKDEISRKLFSAPMSDYFG